MRIQVNARIIVSHSFASLWGYANLHKYHIIIIILFKRLISFPTLLFIRSCLVTFKLFRLHCYKFFSKSFCFNLVNLLTAVQCLCLVMHCINYQFFLFRRFVY